MSAQHPINTGIMQLKGVGMLLVILGHIANPLNHYIYAFHMPLFFFMGGFYLRLRPDFIANHFKRLMPPYFIFALLGILIEALKNYCLHRPAFNLWETGVGLMYWMDYSHLSHYGFILWFLPALMIGKSVAWLLLQYVNHPVVIGGISVVLSAITHYYAPLCPFGLNNGLLALPWILAGYYYFQYCLLVKSWRLASELISVLIIGFTLASSGVPQLNFAVAQFENLPINFIYSLSVSILLTHWMIRISYFNTITPLLFLGRHSLLCCVIHPYTNHGAHILVNALQLNSWPIKLVISLSLLTLLVWGSNQIKSLMPNNLKKLSLT